MNGRPKDKRQTGRRNRASSRVHGRIKIADALRTLIKDKDFNSITTAEIARTAGANEALIYRYFGDKRGLLHYVLSEYMENFIDEVNMALEGVQGAVNRLRKLIWLTANMYNNNRVFSKILLLEVRNFPGYFESETYQSVRKFSQIFKHVIEEGVQNGEFRAEISPHRVRQIVLGGIEHLVLAAVVFGYEVSTDDLVAEMCAAMFDGILRAE